MKDRIVWLMIMVMCMVGYAGAATILICSDAQAPGVAGDKHQDDALIAWLESIGYEVDTYGMDEVYRDGNGGPPVAGNALMDHCLAADIIWISRATNSGDVDENRSAWNEIPTPLLLNGNSAIIRGRTDADRWGWATGDDSGSDGGDNGNHDWRMWDGVKDAYRWDMFDWTGSPAFPKAPKSVGRFEDWPEGTYEGPVGMTDNLGTGTRIIATFNDDDKGVWVEFPAGTDFDAGQNPPIDYRYGTSTAKRVFFGHWGYDGTDTGPGGVAPQFTDYLTDLYFDTLEGVLNELAPVYVDPDFNPAPSCNAGEEQGGYMADLPFQLAATAADEGPENTEAPVGNPAGVVSAEWSLRSGPGAATFNAASSLVDDILNSTVDVTLPGDYELNLLVNDIEGKDANSIVTIHVRADNVVGELIGYWPLDGDADDASINTNNGTFVDVYTDAVEGEFPRYDTDAAIGDYSIRLAPQDYEDPNLPHIDLGPAIELDLGTSYWTVSAWIKTTQQKGSSGDVGKAAIFANGADATPGHRYCLINNEGSTGRVDLVTDDDDNKNTAQTSGDYNTSDGLWHFIVGVRELDEIRIYRDGVLDDTEGIPWVYDLSGTSQWNSRIGAIAKADDPNGIYKGFDGLIDDVKVHNYALNETEIMGLVAEGPIVATVDAGENFAFRLKPPVEPVQLAGSIVDYGINPATGTWTSDDPGAGPAVFLLDTDPATSVAFPGGAGVYTLTLTVIDADAITEANPTGTISDSVVVTVTAPTCADVIVDELLMAYDFDKDCEIGLSDLKIILQDWGLCNDPMDPDCDWPF